MLIKTYNAINKLTTLEKSRITKFIHEHSENKSDTRKAIRKSLDYAAKERAGLGGYVFTVSNNKEITGALVVNKTGMDDYIPENVIVYVVTHQDYRRQGIAKKLMTRAIEHCKGDIALHVTHDNPAKNMFEKMGFTNPYLEMRFKKKSPRTSAS